MLASFCPMFHISMFLSFAQLLIMSQLQILGNTGGDLF